MLHRQCQSRVLIALALVVLPASCAGASPAGLWRTFDDKTHIARGTVRIYDEDGKWFGRIESTFDPAEKDELCVKCAGDRKNKPVIGMVILRGLSQHGSDYSGGDILDPETGYVYRCRISLIGNGKRLLVRGYIGFTVLGRTQVWIRER